MKIRLLATSALTAATRRRPGTGWPLRPLQLGAAGALAFAVATTAIPMSGPALSAVPTPGVDAAIVGDEGGDALGESGENGEYFERHDTGERGDIGEQGEYSDDEFGERGETGWNRPRVDNEGESGELLEGIGEGGQGSEPGTDGGNPLLDGLGEGGGSGGLLE